MEEVNKKLEIIKARLLHSDLPKKAFAFYLEHLELLCNVYFSTGNEWTLLSGNKASVNYCEKRVANLLKMSEEKGIDPDTINAWVDISECFMGVNYYINETQFRILQDFAKRGKIIALPGDINDLDNIHNRSPIAVLDISNIDQYLPINLNGNLPNFSPKVIWSILPSEINTDFYSYTHSSSCSLSEDEKKEFDRLFKVVAPPMLITEEMTTRNLNAMNWFFKLKEVEKLCNHSTNRPYGYYPEHLATLRAFYDQWIIDHPKRLINLGPKFHGNLITRDASWLHDFDIEELRELAIHPKLQNFSTHLVKAWNTKSFVPVTGWFGYTSYQEKTLDPAKYFAFSDLPNWREEFLKERGRQQNNPEWKKWENENQKLLKTLKL